MGRKLIFSSQNVTNAGHSYRQSSALVETHFTGVWMKECELLKKIPVRWGKYVCFIEKLFSVNPHAWQISFSLFIL